MVAYNREAFLWPRLDTQKSKALTKEVKDLAIKEAMWRAPPSREPTVPCTKVRQVVMSSCQSQSPKQVVITHHFKMELVMMVKGVMEKGD